MSSSPNWCGNTLTIHGDPDLLLALLSEHSSSGGEDRATVLSLETVAPTPTLPERKVRAKPDIAATMRLLTQEPGPTDKDDWYSWRVRNWGTKWDVQASLDLGFQPGHDTLVLHMDSAWGPPEAGIQKLSALWPELIFHLSYEEPGMDFAGVTLFRDGEVLERNQFESPSNIQYAMDAENVDWDEYKQQEVTIP